MKKKIRGLPKPGHKSHIPNGVYGIKWFDKFIESTLERERALYQTKS